MRRRSFGKGSSSPCRCVLRRASLGSDSFPSLGWTCAPLLLLTLRARCDTMSVRRVTPPPFRKPRGIAANQRRASIEEAATKV
eukprot:2221416-Alexandrium_andersonii.AAC.1